MMEEKEIVKLFLDKGFQLSKDALPLVLESPDFILNKLISATPRPFIVTSDHVNKILNREETPKMKILHEYIHVNKPVDVEEYFRDLLMVFESAKKVLSNSSALDKLISINKINEKTTEFSTIGMVREILQSNVLIEDPTGEIQLFFGNEMISKIEEIEEDDIIGVKCIKRDGKFYIIQIVFSEIPLQIDIKKSSKKAFLVFSIVANGNISLEQDENSTVMFTMTPDSDKLTLFEISGIKILAIPKNVFKTEQNSKNLFRIIRKRQLSLLSVTPSSYLFLDEIPHIILSNLSPNTYKNHKGITIISNSDEERFYVIDLKTREVLEKTL